MTEVSVSGNIISVPRYCVCCCGEPDTERPSKATRTTGKRVIKTQVRSLDFPYCNACIEHKRRWSWQLAAYIVPFITGGVVAQIKDNLFWLGFFLGTVGAIFMWNKIREFSRESMKESCACLSPVVEFVGWQGSVRTFRFSSKEYANRFMLANKNKLINVSIQAQKDLEQYVTLQKR